MMKDYEARVKKAFLDSEIALTESELNRIDFADFGLDNIETEALNLIVYVNNDRYCAKEMVLLPKQTCPEHRHPPKGDIPGKQETFRCRKGSVYLYVEGPEPEGGIASEIPPGKDAYYTVRHEIILYPGDQYTIDPNIKHWFQAGKEGAVISEFSSPSDDESDVFTDPNIVRV